MERESHPIMKEIIKHKITHNVNRLKTSLKWVVFAILSGVLVGSVGTLFYLCMALVTLVRTKNPWLIFLLPVGGILIVGAYRLLHDERDTGTNLVLSAIHSGDELPLRMAPLIFISTLITHLFGGSAGREGAALQLGGSIGNGLGRLFHFDEKDKHIMIMCGMSAAFSALFGTPMAAAIFSMEVVSVGIMYYAALVPCVISSLIAHAIATSFGVSPDGFPLGKIPDFTIGSAVEISILAILCALVSILFCVMLHGSDHLYKKFFKNPYLRVFAGGCIVVVLTLLVGDQTYNGTGINIIARCMDTYIVLCSYKGKQVIGIGSEDFVKHILCLILQFLHAILYIRCTVGCVLKSGVIVCQLRKSFSKLLCTVSKLINSIAKFLFPAERPVPILLKIHIIHIVG